MLFWQVWLPEFHRNRYFRTFSTDLVKWRHSEYRFETNAIVQHRMLWLTNQESLFLLQVGTAQSSNILPQKNRNVPSGSAAQPSVRESTKKDSRYSRTVRVKKRNSSSNSWRDEFNWVCYNKLEGEMFCNSLENENVS